MHMEELMKECQGIVLTKSEIKRQGTMMKGKWETLAGSKHEGLIGGGRWWSVPAAKDPISVWHRP